MRALRSSFTDALLRLVLDADAVEPISGDLEEMFDAVARRRGRAFAAAWHLGQVVSIVFARLTDRGDGPHVKGRPMAALRQDLRDALRTLWRQPGYTATVAAMLAVGIGANAAIFSLVHAVLLKPLPFADPERLMLVHMTAPDFEDPATTRRMIWSYPKYLVFRDQQQVFEATALFTSASFNLTGTGAPERVFGERVEPAYFGALGVLPQAGRAFARDEAREPGSAPLAVLGHGFWMRRYGGDASVIGRTIGLDGTAHTIVGVLPKGFRGLTGQADLWVPVTAQPPAILGEKWNHAYSLVARLKHDKTIADAQAAVPVLGRIVAREIPDPAGRVGGWGAVAVRLNDDRVDPLIRRSLVLLLVAVAAVLLLVCLNVANLTFARALARQGEVAIRLAIGASRFRVVRQLMTESVLLACLSAVAGLAVASALMTAGASVMPDLRMVLPARSQASGLTRAGLGAMGFDTGVLAFTFAAALAAAVVFGLVPAWRLSRRDLTDAMKQGASGATASGTRGLSGRNMLVAVEMALALVLLTAGGLMLKSVVRLQQTEVGFRAASVLSARLAMATPSYTPARAVQSFERIIANMSARPGVASVAYGSCAPVSGGCNGTTLTRLDRAEPTGAQKPLVGVMWASPGYFDTLGIRLVRGRLFSDRDRAGQPKVVLINETAARAFFADRDAIGARIAVGQGGFTDAEVVGIVADVRYGSVETSVAPDVYLPLLQSPRVSGVLFVRGDGNTEALVSALRAEVQSVDPDLPLTDTKMMRDRIGDAMWRTRIGAWLLGLFAAGALLLAAFGVYGVTSQAVQQQRREIGVRIALGAAGGDILRLMIGRVAAIALAGIALGLVLVRPATRLLTTLLYEVRPGDPLVIGALALLLLSVALAAGYVPARRASRLDPLMTLRSE